MTETADNGVKKTRFIVFEGIDGAGKSSVIKALAGRLIESGHSVLVTWEPFNLKSTPGKGRDVMDWVSDRRNHVRDVINPARHETPFGNSLKFDYILCDRYILSNLVYQSVIDGVDLKRLQDLNREFPKPDHTYLLHPSVFTAMARLIGRYRAGDGLEDDYKNRTGIDLVRLRSRYVDLVSGDSDVTLINADQSLDLVVKDIIGSESVFGLGGQRHYRI